VPLVLSVVPLDWLHGRDCPPPEREPAAVVRAVMSAAGPPSFVPPPGTGAVERAADGTWSCGFLTVMDSRVARVKLDLLWEEHGPLEVSAERDRVVVRWAVPLAPHTNKRFVPFGKKAPQPEMSFEVVVQLSPPGTAVGAVAVTGRMAGVPPELEAKVGERVVALLDGVRRVVGDFHERRAHPRTRATFPVTVFAVHADGRVEPPVGGRCVDVSPGGVAVAASERPATEFAYLAFGGVPEVADLAVLVQFVRVATKDKEAILGGPFRLELWHD
jgi:hypothetical protein